jgi:hypothetical protein
MHGKYPKLVIPDADEVYRANRVAIAEFYGITPAQVDDMPHSDVQDTLEFMWARVQK